MNKKEIKENSLKMVSNPIFWGTIILVFLLGIITGLTPVEEPEKEIIEKEKIVEKEVCKKEEVWKRLKEIDEEIFVVAGDSLVLSSEMIEASVLLDIDKIEEGTAIMNLKTEEFMKLKAKREEILLDLGYTRTN